jgi:glycosyltransferase involved in cell wall biosynthesis
VAEQKDFRVAYFTVKAPYGPGETFVLTEMCEVLRRGEVDLNIYPLRPDRAVSHGPEAEALAEKAVHLPLIDGEILMGFLQGLLWSPLKTLGVIGKVVRHSRPGVLWKNLLLLSKGVYFGRHLQKESIQHIHAHWASTPSTCAYIAAQISDIPWSFTAHRWDIAEDNMLREKVRSACFVRAINEGGRQEILTIVGDENRDKIGVLAMGVGVPSKVRRRDMKTSLLLACIANLVEIKGHKYLLDACRMLKEQGVAFRCFIVGEGPLRAALERKIGEFELGGRVELLGFLPHDRMQELLEKVDIFVLPSIVTVNGEKEGIPVVLMEAMALGIPVVSTRTGGIPELVTEGTGMLVEEKNPQQLAQAVEKFIRDEGLVEEMGQEGRRRVQAAFDIRKNIKRLLERIKKCADKNKEEQ